MPTAQNPTPYGPEPPPDPSGFNENDEQEAMEIEEAAQATPGYYNDNTGLHPTATTYLNTVVAMSETQGTVYATPTASQYHNTDFSPSAIRNMNSNIGNGANGFLTFNSVAGVWGNYTHWGDYSTRTYDAGQVPNAPVWFEGMVLAYSWNYKSYFTSNVFYNVAPTIAFWNSNGQVAYYFFDVIFNEFQTLHGYQNWDLRKDGYPNINWPGMMPVVRSILGDSQIPQQRDKYEKYMVSTYGTATAIAPISRVAGDIASGSTLPTRFRYAAAPTMTTRELAASVDATPTLPAVSSDADEQTASQNPPVFTPARGVTAAGSYTGTGFTINSALTAMDYSHAWLPVLNGFANNASASKTNGGFTSLAAAQVSGAYLAYNDTSSYYSFSDMASFYANAGRQFYSGWLRSGTSTQLVGWVINTATAFQGALAITLVTSGYGFTSVAPTARSGMTNSSTYNLTTANAQSEILANLTMNGINMVGFIYDASVGTYGQVTWISQI